jgi:hypothetical protein
MNIYGDVVTDEMSVANNKVSQLALSEHKRIVVMPKLLKRLAPQVGLESA